MIGILNKCSGFTTWCFSCSYCYYCLLPLLLRFLIFTINSCVVAIIYLSPLIKYCWLTVMISNNGSSLFTLLPLSLSLEFLHCRRRVVSCSCVTIFIILIFVGVDVWFGRRYFLRFHFYFAGTCWHRFANIYVQGLIFFMFYDLCMFYKWNHSIYYLN